MKHMLIVGAGGFLGAILRYKLGGLILHHAKGVVFPLSTFCINISGCFLIGVIGSLYVKEVLHNREIELLLITGLLGGFTTFSAFGLETIYLLKRGNLVHAALYVGLSVAIGILGVWLGFLATSFVKS